MAIIVVTEETPNDVVVLGVAVFEGNVAENAFTEPAKRGTVVLNGCSEVLLGTMSQKKNPTCHCLRSTSMKLCKAVILNNVSEHKDVCWRRREREREDRTSSN